MAKSRTRTANQVDVSTVGANTVEARQDVGKASETASFAGKMCFIVTPIGAANSETRRAADGLLDAVLIPVLETQLGFNVEVAHRVAEPGSISAKVIRDVVNAELVVADLTGPNANVMYELGVRHATGKRTVMICRDPLKLPFDITDQRTIEYVDDMAGSEELKDKLSAAVLSAMSQSEPDVSNPVVDAMQRPVFNQSNPDDPNKYVVDRLDELTRQLSNFMRRNSSNGLLHGRGKAYANPPSTPPGTTVIHWHPAEDMSSVDYLRTLACKTVGTDKVVDVQTSQVALRAETNRDDVKRLATVLTDYIRPSSLSIKDC